MPIYAEVEGVGRLEFPDGTDPAVIQWTVKGVVAQQPAKLKFQPKGYEGPSLGSDTFNALGNIPRGAVDVIGGGAQLLARGANAVGLVPESTGNGFLAGPKEVEAQNNQARANIDAGFGPQQPGLLSSAIRAGSSGALTMPLAPTKFLQAPTMLGRAGGASIGGGIAGAMQEVQNPKDGADFWKKKGVQAIVGAGSAALAQPVAEKVVGAVVSGLNSVADKSIAGIRNMTGANSMDRIVAMTREALKKEGMNFDDLTDDVKAGLLGDVQTALKSYSGANPAAIARQAAFRQESFDPLRHWITKDPAEFGTIENLSHTDVGNPLKQKKADLDQFAMDRLIGMRGPQPIPEQVGRAATADLKSYLDQQNGKTNVLYDTFRQIAPDAKGDPQRFANDVFGGLEGQMALGSLPTGIKNIVNGISEGKIPLTPSVLYQLQKMAKPGTDGSTNFALGHLRTAIDREMDAISQTVGNLDRSMPVVPGTAVPPKEGQYAADVLKMARAQARKVFGELDESRLLSGVAEDKLAPESFGDLLWNSSNKELRQTWVNLSPESRAQVRSEILDMVKTKAFSGASEQSGKSANQATLNSFLNDANNQTKLKLILGDDQFQAVKRLGLMLESAHLQPSGSAVNNSKTGGTLLNAGTKLGEFMKANNIIGNSMVSNATRKGLVESAQYVPGEALGAQSVAIDPLVEEILKRRTGHYAGLLGGVAGFPTIQGLLSP